MTKLTTRKPTSTRLTDTQLFVLSRAAQREDGAAALSEEMTEKAAQKLAAALVRRQLVREIRAKSGMPVWKRSEKGCSHALIITELGRGFSWQEKTYPSLSTIAQAITGTSWNGPRFFGLRGGSGPEAAVEPVTVMKDRSGALSRSSVRSSGHASRGTEGRP
jgi:hypothetical protein